MFGVVGKVKFGLSHSSKEESRRNIDYMNAALPFRFSKKVIDVASTSALIGYAEGQGDVGCRKSEGQEGRCTGKVNQYLKSSLQSEQCS